MVSVDVNHHVYLLTYLHPTPIIPSPHHPITPTPTSITPPPPVPTVSQVTQHRIPFLTHIFRLILKSKRNHFAPHLRTLHLLLIDARIKYKLSSLCFGAIASTGPVYLSDLLQIYTPSRKLRSSADRCLLCISSFNTESYGNHASKRN